MIWLLLALALLAVAAWWHGYQWGKATGKSRHFERGYQAAMEDEWNKLWANQEKYEKLLFEHERLKAQLAKVQQAQAWRGTCS